MEQTLCTGYFLGANSPTGFRSYFESACPVTDDWNIFIIKGGPGSGKSTLMRRVCQEAASRSLKSQQIFCSSDPDSLDGVIIPALKSAIFDGTAPHVMEPAYPGACDHIVNIGQAWSKVRLQAQRSEIIALSAACSGHHAQAMRFLRCADSFRLSITEPSEKAIDRQRLSATAARLASKYCGRSHSIKGIAAVRLLSAVTPKGIFTFSETAESLCSRIVPVMDRFGAPSTWLMAQLRDILLDAGHNLIDCRCSQHPERTEHLLLPECDVAFTVISDEHCAIAATERAVHTERFMPADFIKENKQRFSFSRKSIASFTDLAAEEMRRAKSVHDRLEECYISAMDFDAVNQIAENVCRDIFLCVR